MEKKMKKNVLLLLLLSCFSRVQLCATPKTAAHQQPGGSPVPGILQARTLEWAAISFSSESAISLHVSHPSWSPLSPLPHPTSLGHYRAPSWASCHIHQVPTRHILYFAHSGLCMSMLLNSPHPLRSFRYVCVSIPALQIGSSVPFF